MAVPVQTPYIEYTANGSTNSFALEFDCENQDHLIVLVDEVEPVVGTWSLSNGSVVFGTAPTTGKKITIQRNTPFSRNTDYQSYNNSFRPQSVNGDFDRVWMKLQELGVVDWLLRLYVDQQDDQLQQDINTLKEYVDDKDDELRAYLLEEIRKQGVALDQLDDYYNYLMQQLAQVAIDRGWAASFIVSADGSTQQEINDFGGAKWRNKPLGYDIGSTVKLENGDIVKSTVANNINNPNVDMTGWVPIGNTGQVETTSNLISLSNQKDGDIVSVLSYRGATNFAVAKPYGGGGDFIYKSNTPVKNDGVIWFNNWMRLLDENKLTPEMAGAYGDYVDEANKGHDDSVAFQKVIAYFGENPSVVELDPQKSYYIANQILVPNRTKIYGYGANLYGNAKTNDCFHTAYYNDGVLSDLATAPNNARYLSHLIIDGIRFRNFKLILNGKGLTQGCILNDLRASYSDQFLAMREHFFCTFSNLYCEYMGVEHSGKPVEQRTPAYAFIGFNGMINIQNLQAEHCPLAYKFAHNQPFFIKQCDAERCETAILLEGDQQLTTITNCYLEDNDVHIDVSECSGRVDVYQNFFNRGDLAIKGTSSNIWVNEHDNHYVGDGEGLVRSSGSGSFRINARLKDTVKAYNATYPADNTPNGTITNTNVGYANNFGVHESLVVDYNTSTGAPIAKARSFNGGVVPHIYYGHEGTAYPAGHIPFCSHASGETYGGNLFPIDIMTSIAFNEFTAGIFCFYLTVNGVSGFVRGRFFGSHVIIEQSQMTGMSVGGANESLSGVFKLRLLGFKNDDNSKDYSIRGYVRLIA